MANINRQEVIRQMVEHLRLDVARESTPTELIDKVMPVFIINDIGEIKHVQRTGYGSIVVPDEEVWELDNVFVTVTTTASAGNRRVTLQLLSNVGGVEIMRGQDDVARAASTVWALCFSPLNSAIDQSVLNYAQVHFTKWVNGGQVLNIIDSLAVDGSDTIAMHVTYKAYRKTI